MYHNHIDDNIIMASEHTSEHYVWQPHWQQHNIVSELT